ncbi:MAG: ABC transporter permease [Anaerolineae bacterium]
MFFKRKLVVFGLVVIAILIIVAIFAPWIAPHDPFKQNLTNIRGAPSWTHPLGTDTLGRDLLSRIIYGSRTSLIVGVVAIGLAASIGISLGLIAGYFGGIINTVIMRTIDAMLAVPLILLALTIAALLGSGLSNIVIALGIGLVPPYARLVAGQTMMLKEHDYVSFLRAIGASHARILLRHILPNSFPPVIVLMTTMLGQAILAEAGLSFLGVGVTPPDAAWGAMVSEGYRYLFTTPMLSFAPGLAIMLTVFAVNMVGDGLRDALDPRLRGSL